MGVVEIASVARVTGGLAAGGLAADDRSGLVELDRERVGALLPAAAGRVRRPGAGRRRWLVEADPMVGEDLERLRFLTPTQKYEIFLQLVRGEVTMADAAAAAGVDRTTVVRIRQVAKDGALAALAESRPGVKAGARDVELDAAKAEIARLSETVKEMAVKLMLVEGKGGWG